MMAEQEDDGRWREADVTVNGVALTTAEALTVRVALGSWHMVLTSDESALGDDEHGRVMRQNYLHHLGTVLRRMVPP